MASIGIDNQPIGYFRGNAIYLTFYCAIALAVGTVVVLLLESAGVVPFFFMFSPSAFRHGMLWQPLTYPFVNELGFFTPFLLLCFYSWGVEVEKYLGRKRFISICAALVFVPVLLASLFAMLMGAQFMLGSSYLLTVGLLVSFATLYPDMDYIGGWIPLKWFAFVCISCGSLMYFPRHDWFGLAIMWTNCFLGYALVRHARGLFEFNFNWRRFWPRKKPNLRVLPRPEAARASRGVSTAIADQVDEAEAEIDALLDKIASSGLESLSAAEKERLETLRRRLLQKET